MTKNLTLFEKVKNSDLISGQPVLVGFETQGRIVPKGSWSKVSISAATFSDLKFKFWLEINL